MFRTVRQPHLSVRSSGQTLLPRYLMNGHERKMVNPIKPTNENVHEQCGLL